MNKEFAKAILKQKYSCGGKVKKYSKGGKSPKPNNPGLYSRVKSEAKRKFDVYPSAYANAWLVREYKKRGGGYN